MEMRNIIFRGKRTDNGKWVYSGNLIQFFDNGVREFYISQYGEKCNAVHDIETDHIETITCKNGARFYKVITETVGQYTGLTDKNGKKIFEGDIVTYEDSVADYMGYHDNIFLNCGRVEISEWDGICFTNRETVEMDDLYESETMVDCEVIGNIHDNHEFVLERG